MSIHDYPVYTRVVNTHNGLRAGMKPVNPTPIGQRGTVIGYMKGTHTGEDRLLVLFDGQHKAVQKNPLFVRKDT